MTEEKAKVSKFKEAAAKCSRTLFILRNQLNKSEKNQLLFIFFGRQATEARRKAGLILCLFSLPVTSRDLSLTSR